MSKVISGYRLSNRFIPFERKIISKNIYTLRDKKKEKKYEEIWKKELMG